MSIIDDLERAERAATPGPWSDFAESGAFWIEGADTDGSPNGAWVGAITHGWDGPDLSLIIKSRNALPALLRVVRAAQALDAFVDFGEPLGQALGASEPAPMDAAARELYDALRDLNSEAQR